MNKFIDSLSNSERIREKLKRLIYFKSNQKLGLDIARFKGKQKDRYRVRIGEVRFIFQVISNKIFIDAGDYRGRVYSWFGISYPEDYILLS